MGLFDSMNAGGEQATAILGSGQPAMMGQQGAGNQQPMPAKIHPEMQKAIDQMKDAPPEQKQEFIRQIMQSIAGSVQDPAARQQAQQEFIQAMGEDSAQAPSMPQPMLGGA